MNVKGDTKTILRKHTSCQSKSCDICSPDMKGDTCEKQISFANPVILEPLILPEEQRHTVSAVGQLEEKLSENCGEDISDKEKTICVSLKMMKEVNVDRKKKVQKEVIKRNDESLIPPSESVSD